MIFLYRQTGAFHLTVYLLYPRMNDLCSLAAGVQTVCRQLWERVAKLEEELYDTERLYIVREAEVLDTVKLHPRLGVYSPPC